MPFRDKDAAQTMAIAHVRRNLSRHCTLPTVKLSVETDADWIFDFYFPRWQEFRRRGITFGARIAVDKSNGRTRHFANLGGATTAKLVAS